MQFIDMIELLFFQTQNAILFLQSCDIGVLVLLTIQISQPITFETSFLWPRSKIDFGKFHGLSAASLHLALITTMSSAGTHETPVSVVAMKTFNLYCINQIEHFVLSTLLSQLNQLPSYCVKLYKFIQTLINLFKKSHKFNKKSYTFQQLTNNCKHNYFKLIILTIMTTVLPVGKDLQKILQRVQPGFAYELLSLQIDLELQTSTSLKNQPKIQSITRLIQLYMGAVEALQSKCDKRYKYFSTKIQGLMKKKHVVQQLHIASTGRHADQSALEEVFKAEIGQRKNELDLQIFLNKEQFDTKKIREIMKTADNKLKTFEKNIEKNLKKQDEELQQRKRIRKLKSDAGSVTKIDLDRYFQSPAKKFVIKSQKQLDQYFKIDPKPNQQKKRSASIEKKQTENSKISPNAKLKNLVI